MSPSRAITLPDGSRASAIPQDTEGPAGYAGEKGCSLAAGGGTSGVAWALMLMAAIVVIGAMRSRSKGARAMIMVLAACLLVVAAAQPAEAARKSTPQWWSAEAKVGFWMPTASKTSKFFDTCCNLWTRIQAGVLIHGRYGIEESVGLMFTDGTAIGSVTGEPSQDSFSIFLIPFETNFAWRLDYWSWRYIIPYFKVGIDYVYFRENTRGDIIEGLKWGMHGTAGMQFPLAQVSDDVSQLDRDYGLNDVNFVIEGQYGWINDFGGGGLDLSGWLFSAGFLFTF